jgi:hypothetical protein
LPNNNQPAKPRQSTTVFTNAKINGKICQIVNLAFGCVLLKLLLALSINTHTAPIRSLALIQYTINMSDLNANNTSAGSGMGAIASIGSMISTA